MGQKAWADDDVKYDIPLYQGKLDIYADNTASFQQEVTYHFRSNYHGQSLTLGTKDMPRGFDIKKASIVSVQTTDKNGQAKYPLTASKLKKIKDGYQLKVYDKGEKGDTVTVKANWNLKNMTTLYSDIAELNWRPVSNWDQTIGKVIFHVSFPSAENKNKEFFVHRGVLKELATITKESSSSYHLEVKKLEPRDVLELHASLSSWAFPNLPHEASAGLKSFKAKEEKVQNEENIYRKRTTIIFPVLSLGLVLTGLLINLAFKWKTQQKFVGHHQHLFQAPEDLTPLELVRKIYGLKLADVPHH